MQNLKFMFFLYFDLVLILIQHKVNLHYRLVLRVEIVTIFEPKVHITAFFIQNLGF